MVKIQTQEPQSPIILRSYRLVEAFAKADDERDFYIDRQEGFLIYVDLDKSQDELDALFTELQNHPDRYLSIPKLSNYEVKKIMEGFAHEKIYDIDTKEKLNDIIQSKESREHFVEFLNDHLIEQEKWTQYYQERARVRTIEWLRQNHFHFVFEEDLDLPRHTVEELKQSLFDVKVSKEVVNGRKILLAKAKTYYSNDALHPKPKRGRPPKQIIKLEIEPQLTRDIYLTLPLSIRPFLFSPEPHSTSPFAMFGDLKEGHEQTTSLRKSILGDDLASWSQEIRALRALPPANPSTELSLNALEGPEKELEDWNNPSEQVTEKKRPLKKSSPKPKKTSPATPKKAKTVSKQKTPPEALTKKKSSPSPKGKRIIPVTPKKRK